MSTELERMNEAFEAWWTHNELPVPRESARWIFNAGWVHSTSNPDRIQVGGVSVAEVAKRLANFEKGMRQFVRCPMCHDDIPLDKEGKFFPHRNRDGPCNHDGKCTGSGMQAHYTAANYVPPSRKPQLDVDPGVQDDRARADGKCSLYGEDHTCA